MTGGRPAIVIVGAGGHARVVVDMLQQRADFELAGCVSPEPAADLLGLPVLGGDDSLADIFSSGVRHAFVAIGDNRVRAERLRHARQIGFVIANAISPHAVISPRATIGTGIAIMPGAVVNVGSVAFC